jgi:hypothetical protein
MIYAVVGAGPRTGTSWVMGQLHAAGLPVYWTKSIKIPGAEYETNWKELPNLRNVIAKVWPGTISVADIGRVVILRRDRDEQVISLRKQMERERIAGYKCDETAEELIDRCVKFADAIRLPKIEIRTEDLNSRINEIIGWLSEPFEYRRTA